MSTVNSPWMKQQFFDSNGNPAVNYRVFTYVATTSTKLATNTDFGGLSANTNPIVLDYRGEANIWLPPNVKYKFVFALPGTDDPPTNPIWTVDNVVNSQLVTLYGGVDSGTANAYVLNFTANFTAYSDGIVIYWIPGNTNTAASTVNVNGLGVVNIQNYDGSSLTANQIVANSPTEMIYIGGAFVLLSNPATATAYSSSFTPTWGGFGGTPPTGTMYFQVVGTVVTLNWVLTGTGVSNATSLSILNLPIAIRPLHSSGVVDGATIPCMLLDNNIAKIGGARITTSGTINFGLGATPSETGFTNPGNKGLLNGWSITYGLK